MKIADATAAAATYGQHPTVSEPSRPVMQQWWRAPLRPHDTLRRMQAGHQPLRCAWSCNHHDLEQAVQRSGQPHLPPCRLKHLRQQLAQVVCGFPGVCKCQSLQCRVLAVQLALLPHILGACLPPSWLGICTALRPCVNRGRSSVMCGRKRRPDASQLITHRRDWPLSGACGPALVPAQNLLVSVVLLPAVLDQLQPHILKLQAAIATG